MARQVMIRHRRPRDPRRMDGVDRDDFLTAAWPTTEPSSPSLGQEHPVFWTVRLRLPLAVCGASPRSHLWIWRLRSPCHIQGKWQCLWWQLLLCLSVFVGTYTVTEHRWYCSTPPDLCTRPDSLNIVYVRPFPVDTNCSYFGQSYWPIPAQTNFHCATTLSCHYIQYSASEPCSCPGCCIYTYMAPNTPTFLPYSTFFKPTFMWFMVGAGVIGRPFLSLLDGTPHKQAW